DEAIERANSGYGPMRHDYLSLKKFKEVMNDFLAEFRLPKNILRSGEWETFVKLYAGIVSDCPVTRKDYPFKFIEQISIRGWQPENAPQEYLKLLEQEFRLQWWV